MLVCSAMRLTARWLLSLSLLLTSFALVAQQQYRESVEVLLHNLDTIVTDRAGNPVKGLTREDFVVLEDGVPQEITNFSFFESGTSTVALDGSTPAAVAENAPPSRRFVFFIDEMAIQAGARKQLKEHARALVQSMRPGDVATVVRPTAAARIAQDYTGDAAAVEKALLKAIDDCKIRLTAPAFRELTMFRRALETAHTPNEVAAAKRLYVDAARQRVEQRLGQLRALLTSMAGSDGKKILVIVTSGLSSQPGREAYDFKEQIGLFEAPPPLETMDDPRAAPFTVQRRGPGDNKNLIRKDVQEGLRATTNPTWAGMERTPMFDFRPAIDAFARSAAAEGVTIYALEPEVPLMLNNIRGADSRTIGSTLLSEHTDGNKIVPAEMLNQLLHYEGQTLTSMTEKTGGKWFRGVGGIDDTFKQVTSDLQAYYSIAYRQKESKTNKPRRVQVSVKDRPELHVRTRTEVIDPAGAGDMSARVLASLLYPREVNDLKMSVSTEKPQRKGRAYLVPVQVVIPVDKITFIRAHDGKYKGRVEVQYATARDEKEFVSYGRQEQIIELSDRQFAELQRIRYRYKSEITVPRGRIRIALGVTDSTSKVSSLQTLSVEAK